MSSKDKDSKSFQEKVKEYFKRERSKNTQGKFSFMFFHIDYIFITLQYFLLEEQNIKYLTRR